MYYLMDKTAENTRRGPRSQKSIDIFECAAAESRLKCFPSYIYVLSRPKLNYRTLARIAVNGFIFQLARLLMHRQRTLYSEPTRDSFHLNP